MTEIVGACNEPFAICETPRDNILLVQPNKRQSDQIGKRREKLRGKRKETQISQIALTTPKSSLIPLKFTPSRLPAPFLVDQPSVSPAVSARSSSCKTSFTIIVSPAERYSIDLSSSFKPTAHKVIRFEFQKSTILFRSKGCASSGHPLQSASSGHPLQSASSHPSSGSVRSYFARIALQQHLVFYNG
jgi:hypothetical protein